MSPPPVPPSDQPWQRLAKRMLLVHPITEVVRYIPVLIGSVILGTSSGNPVWSIIPLTLIVGFALTRWFTTTYRVGPTHVELRTGLVQRKKLSVPRSRIRSVDIEADVLHRILGLAVLAIGTGQQADSSERFELDALDARAVPRLRTALLAPAAGTAEPADRRNVLPEKTSDVFTTVRTPAQEIGHWRPEWVRYAPLSLTGFAIIAPIIGVAFQYGLGEVLFRSDAVHDVENSSALVLAIAAAALVLTIVVVVGAASCAHYLTTYYGLRVTDNGKTLQLRHGLFTTRQITLDLARLRGATVKEPLLLRLAGAAELEAIMTGEKPRQKILPQAPRAAIEHTLSHLLAPNELRDYDIPPPPDRSAGGAGPLDAPETTRTATRSNRTGGTPEKPEAVPESKPPGLVSNAAADHRATGHDRPRLDGSVGDSTPPGTTERGATAQPGATTDVPVQPSAARRSGPASSGSPHSYPAPGNAPLIPHGPVARRRRHVRTLLPVVLTAAVLIALSLVGQHYSLWVWAIPTLSLPAALALAEDRYRGLGHAVLPATATTPTWLVTRSGSLDRDRDCLKAPGVIGWTVRQTLFQRRAGVATVVAATAAGTKHYAVIDIPIEKAWQLIEAVTPGQLGTR
ncbi:PH domain-containing protein [Nocardia sp. NPDC049190]|uniref:PH domain-containing protein n=1 Tax=Nocardia sp. NPDC049190 TaxID=3155650 RepID=UPI0033FFD8AC